MNEMLRIVVGDYRQDLPLMEKFKYPSVACEILTSNSESLLDCMLEEQLVNSIDDSLLTSAMEIDTSCTNEVSSSILDNSADSTSSSMDIVNNIDKSSYRARLPSSRPHIDTLLKFFDVQMALAKCPCSDPEITDCTGINPLYSSYFSRIMIHLASQRTDKIIPYLRTRHNFLSNLLDHLGIPAIADLLVQFWFNEEHLIRRLLDGLSAKNSSDSDNFSFFGRLTHEVCAFFKP
ncbi:unnamed protein product [Protopolystoma xenopodis]|uniref:Uncharacterized protein n=1 Tax=Protopolystoma xenopodis TaxID=117903 RepID=A0A448WDE3_9PLAT|nr:unnamed protein product [Protopolystoma xenopodis]